MVNYIALCLEDVPANFEPLGDADATVDAQIGLKESFLYFANLERDEQRLRSIEEALNGWYTDLDSAIERLPELEKRLYPIVGGGMIPAFMSIVQGSIREAIDDDQVIFSLFSCIEPACNIANHYADMLCAPDQITPNGNSNKENIIFTINAGNHFGIGFDFKYLPVLGFCGEDFTFINAVLLTDALSLVNMAAITIIKEGIVIRRCCNCGDYFLPSSRSDEIYCDKILPNGKTCKTIGYDEKVKRDSTLREYRKIYKTQNARKQRNGHRAHIAEYFDQWTKFAKVKLRQCQNGEITLDQMVKEISTDSWMDGTR